MSSNAPSRRGFLTQSALLLAAAGLNASARAADETKRPSGAGSIDAGAVLTFPREFLFGCASAAYQIEGGWNADGKGESIWDRWSHTGHGVVTGDVVADHYHRYREDVDLLRELGVNAYRLSIAWTRLFPDDSGRVNPAGVAFYKDLIARLRAAGITPAVTLYHWDLPQWLQDRGGWANRQTVDAFAAYARVAFQEFGADVGYWITFNEPWVSAFVGHWIGKMAPGHTDLDEALQVTHHLLLAHGRAVSIFRELHLPGRIGITLDLYLGLPATSSPEDQRAAEMINLSHHAWFADPIYKGEYPAAVCAAYVKHGYRLPEIRDGDWQLIHQPIDFLGLNYYNADVWKHDPVGGWGPYEATKVDPPEKNLKLPDWRPDGLRLLLERLHTRYAGPEIIITENGYYADDFVNHRGEVNDEARIEYIYRHLEAARQAMDEGVRLRGYFVWSFLDDYEWGEFGRMGLVYMDYRSLKRIVKRSGRWYAECVRERTFRLP